LFGEVVVTHDELAADVARLCAALGADHLVAAVLGPMKYFRQKFGEKNGVFDSKQCLIMQNFDHNIVF
jgi:hypothetical protein